MSVEFDATIVSSASGRGGALVDVPDHVVAALGGGKARIPVVATFDGVEYRGSLMRMGGPGHCIGILKDLRAAIGKQVGDTVAVTLTLDDAPRVVELPDDVAAALDAAGARAANDPLS